ncbi:conserved Plasmodium protein, unknown function [Plasmodium ovale]|uniref:Uncharacterized protein n=1 Tax=Plasmodium ovale TaxID=36330 RepID=A0A1C3KS91_PLAOA|nr:conserved Plasmodium protein, unknown function [Plasmodium ovale]
MLVQKYAYGGFLNLHKMLSNSSLNIIQEIKISNNITDVIDKLREYRKYNDNIYEKFKNSCTPFVEKLYTETFLNIDKSLIQLNDLLVREVKYLLQTKSEVISDASKLSEENFKKNLVDKLYEEFLQQERLEKDENSLLYFNKINMAHKLRKFLNLYSIDDVEAHEIILSLIQIDDGSKINVNYKSILKNFDYILNSSKPYTVLKAFFNGGEDVINDSFLRTYWMCLKNLHLYFKSYNAHVLSILGDDFKNVIFKYIDDVICNQKQKVIYEDKANYFLNIFHFFDSFSALIISKVHNSKVTILNENGILISIHINTLPDKLIQLLSTKYYSGTLIPHRIFDDLTFLLVHENFPILNSLTNFEVTSIYINNTYSPFSDNKYDPTNETIRITSVTSQENEKISKCIKDELLQKSQRKKGDDVTYYKTVDDIIRMYKGSNPMTEEAIYLLLLNIVKGKLTNLSLLFSIEIINYLDDHCADVFLSGEDIRDNLSKEEKEEKKEKEDMKDYYNDIGFHIYYSDRLDSNEDAYYNTSMENTSTSFIYDNPKLKKLYDAVSESVSSHIDGKKLKSNISKYAKEKLGLKKAKSVHALYDNSTSSAQKKKEDLSSNEPMTSPFQNLSLHESNDDSQLLVNTDHDSDGSFLDTTDSTTDEYDSSSGMMLSDHSAKRLSKSMPDLSSDLDNNSIHSSKNFTADMVNDNISAHVSGMSYQPSDNTYINSNKKKIKENSMRTLSYSSYSSDTDLSQKEPKRRDTPTIATTATRDEKGDEVNNKVKSELDDFDNFPIRSLPNMSEGKNNINNEEENYEKNMKEIMNSTIYLRNLCKKKKIMEIEKLKSVKELKYDLLRTKHSFFNKNVLFLNEKNLKNIFESTFFDSNVMKNCIIKIMSSYEIGNLQSILNVNMSNLNFHFHQLRNIFYNKKKILSFFSLSTSQNVIDRIETKLYSVFTIVWLHYTNYLRKVLDVFATSELRLLSNMYHNLMMTNKDENHLSLLNSFGFTDVFMMYILIITLRRNVYYINQNKSFDIHNLSLFKVEPLQIARGYNGFYYIFKNTCATKVINDNEHNKYKIDAGFGLSFFSVKKIEDSEVEGEARMFLAKRSLLTMLDSIPYGSVSYNINNKKETEKYPFLTIYRNENANVINDVPALITAIICGQMYEMSSVKKCIKKDNVFTSYSSKINSIIYNFYNNSINFKNTTFMDNTQSYYNIFSSFYTNEKILLATLLQYLKDMNRDSNNLANENEVRHHLSFIYNLVKHHILKKTVENHEINLLLYNMEEIIFKHKLYSEKVATTLISLSEKHAGNDLYLDVLDTISLIFYHVKVGELDQNKSQGIPDVHSDIVIMDLMDVINIVKFFNKVLNKITTTNELEQLIDKENVIKLHLNDITTIVQKIFQNYENYFYDIIDDNIRNNIKNTLIEKMKNLFIYYKKIINEESKKLTYKFEHNLKKKKSFLIFEGPISYSFPIEISYGKITSFEEIFFLDLIEYSYSDYTSSHLKYINQEKHENNKNMSELIQKVKRINLLYHMFDIPKEYNEKLFNHIFDFAQEASVNKSFVQKGKLWGRNVPRKTYSKLCKVNLHRLIKYYFESSQIGKLVEFMLKYNENKIEIKKPKKEGKVGSSLYSCLKEQWVYKQSFKNVKPHLSNIKLKFKLSPQDIKVCVQKNSGYPHLRTLTSVMLNVLAYELQNIFNIKHKFISIFSHMIIKMSDISIKMLFKINNMLNIKQKIALFYYSKNALLHITEILSHHFKEKIVYFSENKEGGYDVHSFKPAKKNGDMKVVILKEGNTFRVYQQSDLLFSYDMHHLRDTSIFHIYYEELVKMKNYLESLEGKYTEEPNYSVEDVHAIIRDYSHEKNYKNVQQMILVLTERKDIGNSKKTYLRNLIDLDIVKHQSKRVKDNYLHLLYLEIFSLFGFGLYSNLDTLLKDLFLCNKGMFEWFQGSISEMKKNSNESNQYNNIPLFVSSLRHFIKKLERVTSKKSLEKNDLDYAANLIKKSKEEIGKFDLDEMMPVFLKKNKKEKTDYNNTMYGNKIEEFKIDEKVKDKVVNELEQYKFSVPSEEKKPYYFVSLIGLGYSYIQKFNELKLGLHSSVSSRNAVILKKMYNLFHVNELMDVINLLINTIINVYSKFFYANKEFTKDGDINLSKKKKKEFGELVLSKENVNIDLIDSKSIKRDEEKSEEMNIDTGLFPIHEYYLNYVIKNSFDFFYTVLGCSDVKTCFLSKDEYVRDVIKKYLRESPFNKNMIWLIPLLSHHFRSSLIILYMKENEIRLYKYQDDSSMKFSIQILVQDEKMFLILPTYFIHINILNIITNTFIKNENDITNSGKVLSPLYSKVTTSCKLTIDESLANRVNSDNYYNVYFKILDEKINLLLTKKMHIYTVIVSIREDVLNFKYVMYYENFVKFLKLMDTFIEAINLKIQLHVDFTFEDIFNSTNTQVKHSINNIINFIEKDGYNIFGLEIKKFYSNILQNYSSNKYQSGTFLRVLDFLLNTIKLEIDSQNKLINFSSNEVENNKNRLYIQKLKSFESFILCEHIKIVTNIMKYVEINFNQIINHIVYKRERQNVEEESINKVDIIHECCLKYDFNELGANELTKKYFNELENKNMKIVNYTKNLQTLSNEELDYEEWYHAASKIQVEEMKKSELAYFKILKEDIFWKEGAKNFTSNMLMKKLKEQKVYIEGKDIKKLSNKKLTFNEYKDMLYGVKINSKTEYDIDVMYLYREHYAISFVWKFFNTEVCINGHDINFDDVYEKLKNYKKDLQYLSLLSKDDIYNMFNSVVIFHRFVESIDEDKFNKYKSYRITNILFDELMNRGIYISGDTLVTKEYIESVFNYDMWKKDIKYVKVSNVLIRSLVPIKYVNYHSSAPIYKLLRFFLNSRFNVRFVNLLSYVIYKIFKMDKMKNNIFHIIMSEGILRGTIDVIRLILIKFNISLERLTIWFTTILTNLQYIMEHCFIQDILESIDFRRAFSNLFFLLHNLVEECYFKSILNLLHYYPFILEFMLNNEDKIKEILLSFKRFFLLNFGTFINFFQHLYDNVETKLLTYLKYYATKIVNNLLPFSSDLIEKIMQIEMQSISLLEFISFHDEESIVQIYQNVIALVQHEDFMNNIRKQTLQKHKEFFSDMKKVEMSKEKLLDDIYTNARAISSSNKKHALKRGIIHLGKMLPSGGKLPTTKGNVSFLQSVPAQWKKFPSATIPLGQTKNHIPGNKSLDTLSKKGYIEKGGKGERRKSNKERGLAVLMLGKNTEGMTIVDEDTNLYDDLDSDYTEEDIDISFLQNNTANIAQNYYLIETNKYRTLSCLEKLFLHAFDSNINSSENKIKVCSSLHSHNWTNKAHKVSIKRLSDSEKNIYGYTHNLFLYIKMKNIKCEMLFKLHLSEHNKNILNGRKYKNAIVDFNIFRENNELCFLIINSKKKKDKDVLLCYNAELVPFYRNNDISNYLNKVFTDVDSLNSSRKNENNDSIDEYGKEQMNDFSKYPFNIIDKANRNTQFGDTNAETEKGNNSTIQEMDEKRNKSKEGAINQQGNVVPGADIISPREKSPKSSTKFTINKTFKKIKKGIRKLNRNIKKGKKSEEGKDNLNDNIEKISDALKYLSERKIINQLLEFEYFHSTKWTSNIFSVTIDTMKGENENIKLSLELGDYNIKTYYEVDLKDPYNVEALQKLDEFIKKSNVRDLIAQRLKKYTKLNLILKYIFKINHEIKHVSYVKSTKQVRRGDGAQGGNSNEGKEAVMENSLEEDTTTEEEYLKFTWYKEKKKRRENVVLVVKSINPLRLKDENSEILCETNANIEHILHFLKSTDSAEGATAAPTVESSQSGNFSEEDNISTEEIEDVEVSGETHEEQEVQEKHEVTSGTVKGRSPISGVRIDSVEEEGAKGGFFSDYARYFSKIYPLTEEENYYVKMIMDRKCALLKYRLVLLSVVIIKSNNLSNLRKMGKLSNEYLNYNYVYYKNIEYNQKELFREKNVYIENKHYIIKKKLECLIGLNFYKSLKSSLEKKKILDRFLEDLAVEVSEINNFFYKYFYNDNSNIHCSNFYMNKMKNVKTLCPIIYELKSKEKINLTDTSKIDNSIKLDSIITNENELDQCERDVGFYGSNISFFGKILDNSIGKSRIKNIAMFSYQCEKSIFNGMNLSELDEYHKNFCINMFAKELEDRDEPFKQNTEWIDMLYNTFSSKKNDNYVGNNYSEIKCFGFADRDELKEYEKKKDAKCKITILSRTLNVLQQFIDKYYKIKNEGIHNGNAYNVYTLYKNIYTVMIYKLMFETRPFKPLRVQQKLNVVGNKYTKLLHKKENYSKFLKHILDKTSTMYLEIELLYNEHVFLRNIPFPSESVDILIFNHRPFNDDAYGYKLSASPYMIINEGEENTKVYAFFVLILLGYYPEIQKSLLHVSENADLIYKLLEIDIEEFRKILQNSSSEKHQAKDDTLSFVSFPWSQSASSSGSGTTSAQRKKQHSQEQENITDKITSSFGTIYNYLFSKPEDEGTTSSNVADIYEKNEINENSSMNDEVYEINDFTWMGKEQIYSIKKLIVQHELVDIFIKGIKMINIQSFLKGENYLEAFKKALNEELKKKDFYHHFIRTTPLFNFDSYKVQHLLLFAFYYSFADIIRIRRQYVNLESDINRSIDNNKMVYSYRTKSYKHFNLETEKRAILNKDHEEIAKFIYKYAIQYRYGREDYNNVLFKFDTSQIDQLMNILNNKKKQIYTAEDLREITSFVEVMVENYIFILNNYPSSFSLSKHSSFYENFIKNVKQFFFSFNKKNNLIYIINQRDINYNMQSIKHINDKSTIMNIIKSTLQFVFLAATRSYNADEAIKNVISHNEDITFNESLKLACSNCKKVSKKKSTNGYVFLQRKTPLVHNRKKYHHERGEQQIRRQGLCSNCHFPVKVHRGKNTLKKMENQMVRKVGGNQVALIPRGHHLMPTLEGKKVKCTSTVRISKQGKWIKIVKCRKGKLLEVKQNRHGKQSGGNSPTLYSEKNEMVSLQKCTHLKMCNKKGNNSINDIQLRNCETDLEKKSNSHDALEIAGIIEYNFTEHESKKSTDSSLLDSFLGTRMNTLYSKLKGGVFSFTFIHGFDFFIRNSLYFYKTNLISKYITHYVKMHVVQSLDMLILIVRDYELKTSLTNTNSMKHSLFNICLFNLQYLSVSLKNILNIIDEKKIERILSNIIATIHMRYTGNARFIENIIMKINLALAKNITLKKMFGNFVSYLTISSIQTLELYFHSRYKKKLLNLIIIFLNKLSGTISNILGEPFFQSYMCTHLIKLGESFISEFNAENTVYRFFMDVGDINFIDIIISYAYKYFPKAVHDFTEE